MVGQFASLQHLEQILPKVLNQEQVTPCAFLLIAWSQKGTESICISVIFLDVVLYICKSYSGCWWYAVVPFLRSASLSKHTAAVEAVFVLCVWWHPSPNKCKVSFCVVKSLYSRMISLNGPVIIVCITSSLRRMQIHTMQNGAFSLLTWAGCWCVSTLTSGQRPIPLICQIFSGTL